MSFVLHPLQAIFNAGRIGLQRVMPIRGISQSLIHRNEQTAEGDGERSETSEGLKLSDDSGDVNSSKDRSKVIPVETSIKYLSSRAYRTTYGNDPVWKLYRRNYKGQIAPSKTRKTCIRSEKISTGNPCPICRDEYLVLDHRNIDLLKQFISPYSGEIISYQKTGICQRQYQNLLIAIYRAKDFGTITFDVPVRNYNYSDWYDTKTGTQ